uniref:Secreted protein n=1 Tax=Heterorhabditis bacteriophora TaxID=37862 RepID=A0A1I7WV60_HETBA
MCSFFVFLLLISPSSALIDCVYGFVGRIQASVEDNFFQVSDTQICAAALCIKVIIHSALDDDNVFQQGISSRCAYTGEDREACRNANFCSTIATYDGMRGNETRGCGKENG